MICLLPMSRQSVMFRYYLDSEQELYINRTDLVTAIKDAKAFTTIVENVPPEIVEILDGLCDLLENLPLEEYREG